MSAKAEICFQPVLKGQHVGSQNLTPGRVLKWRGRKTTSTTGLLLSHCPMRAGLLEGRIVGGVPIQFSCLFAKLIGEYNVQITWYVISDFNVCIFQRRQRRLNMILAKLFKLRLFIILYHSQWNNSFCKAKDGTLCQKMATFGRASMSVHL